MRFAILDDEESGEIWEVRGPLTALKHANGSPFHVPPGKVCGFYGDNGGGKTTLAMLTLPKAGFATTEMDWQLVVDYRRRLRKDFDRKLKVKVPILEPWFADEADAQAYEVNPGDMIGFKDARTQDVVDAYGLEEIIFDSVSETPNQAQVVEWMIYWAKETGGRAICIFWQTESGDMWGGARDKHRVHSRVQFTRDETGVRTAIVHKDRSGVTGQISFALGDDDETDPTVDAQFVSVEGRAGRYSLLPHPNPKAKASSVYKALEGQIKMSAAERESYMPDELPDPPCAVAARYSPLYKDGWVEPKDWKERARLALREGYTYFSPIYGVIADQDDLQEI